MTTDVFLSDFSDARFQTAFRMYFDELGIQVQNWDGLWQEMNADENAINYAFVRMDEEGEIIGFIQFCPLTMKSWFFEEPMGFIREFWIRRTARGQGHGTALLTLAEDWFRKQGVFKCILTTDTAPGFYIKQGYHPEKSISARNKDNVFVKTL